MTVAPTVLIVDDDPLLRQITRQILAAQGYTLLEAENGNEALRLVREHHPDLVLLDVALPDINGMQVCREIKADPELATILIVFLSAQHADTASRIQGLDTGADGYIARPVNPRELVARVQAMLRIKATEDALRESEQRFRMIYEHIPVGIVQTSPECRIQHANPAFCQMLGYAGPELVGKRFDEIVPVGSWSQQQAQQTELAQGKINHYRTETSFVRRDGNTVHVVLDANLIRSPAGQPAYFLITVVDVTAYKLAEAQLARQAEELRRWHEINLAHELRIAELERQVNALLKRP